MGNTVTRWNAIFAGFFVLILSCPGSAATYEAGLSSEKVETLFKHNCYTCHGTGLPGAPQLGETGEWLRRLQAGREQLYRHAEEGFIGESGMLMPPRGGNPELSEEEVKAIVDYILDVSGVAR